MYICICNSITDKEIRQAILLGATTLPALKDALGVTNNCGRCEQAVGQVLAQATAEPVTNGTS